MLFVVYGTPEEVPHSTIAEWAREADYAEEKYLDTLPQPFRQAVERTLEVL